MTGAAGGPFVGAAGGRELTLDDVVDLRAYEREREAFRRRIIELKRHRRVAVGPLVSFVFENRDTVRFQVQEMIRAERMISDEQVLGELRAYNPLIPAPGELSATLLVELTSEAELRGWLPRLVGIERAAYLRIGAVVVHCEVEETHAEQLTREDVTAAVHYVRFRLDDDRVASFGPGPVSLGIDLAGYAYEVPLGDEVRAELMRDLLP